MISDLLPDDLKKDARLIELMLSDSIVKPAMSRANSNSISSEIDNLVDEFTSIETLPVLHKFARNDGI